MNDERDDSAEVLKPYMNTRRKTREADSSVALPARVPQTSYPAINPSFAGPSTVASSSNPPKPSAALSTSVNAFTSDNLRPSAKSPDVTAAPPEKGEVRGTWTHRRTEPYELVNAAVACEAALEMLEQVVPLFVAKQRHLPSGTVPADGEDLAVRLSPKKASVQPIRWSDVRGKAFLKTATVALSTYDYPTEMCKAGKKLLLDKGKEGGTMRRYRSWPDQMRENWTVSREDGQLDFGFAIVLGPVATALTAVTGKEWYASHDADHNYAGGPHPQHTTRGDIKFSYEEAFWLGSTGEIKNFDIREVHKLAAVPGGFRLPELVPLEEEDAEEKGGGTSREARAKSEHDREKELEAKVKDSDSGLIGYREEDGGEIKPLKSFPELQMLLQSVSILNSKMSRASSSSAEGDKEDEQHHHADRTTLVVLRPTHYFTMWGYREADVRHVLVSRLCTHPKDPGDNDDPPLRLLFFSLALDSLPDTPLKVNREKRWCDSRRQELEITTARHTLTAAHVDAGTGEEIERRGEQTTGQEEETRGTKRKADDIDRADKGKKAAKEVREDPPGEKRRDGRDDKVSGLCAFSLAFSSISQAPCDTLFRELEYLDASSAAAVCAWCA
ncbi:hypothetical protein JCM11251_005040 [Rhodosporidiobolus azoricus]